MKKISDLIKKNDWSLIYKSYTTYQIVEELSFEESMRLAYQMLINKEGDDDLMNFAVDLLQSIRKKHPRSWELDWKNDLFLGDACHITMRYDERYEAYKRASLKFNSVPPNLLVSLARCYSAPGIPPISIDEAESLIRAALEKEKSIEAVTLIRGICKSMKREEEFSYWNKILQELEKKEAYMKSEWPEYLTTSFIGVRSAIL